VTRLRLKRARTLLQDPALNIADAAHACGFSDPNYFTRCFRKALGTTPGPGSSSAIAPEI
jgi:transcriptional regulator GlxA family with amidase domain